MLAGAVVVSNVPDDGLYTLVVCGSDQPSHTRKFPVCISTDWIATSGQLCSVDHCPWPGCVCGCGVTALDGTDAMPVPTPFVAVTVKVYVVPSVRPLIAADVAGGAPVTTVVGCAVEPMYGVTVYDVIWLPPSGGAVHVTAADASPAAALTPVGTPGTVGGPELTPGLNTTTAASHVVFAPVLNVAFCVVPDADGASSV